MAGFEKKEAEMDLDERLLYVDRNLEGADRLPDRVGIRGGREGCRRLPFRLR